MSTFRLTLPSGLGQDCHIDFDTEKATALVFSISEEGSRTPCHDHLLSTAAFSVARAWGMDYPTPSSRWWRDDHLTVYRPGAGFTEESWRRSFAEHMKSKLVEVAA